MTTGGKPEAYKVTVTQTYDVYLYFAEGINTEDDEEKFEIILDSAVDSAFQHEGLAAVRHDDTPSYNGYLTHVTTHDPTVNLKYKLDVVPTVMAVALEEKGFIPND